MLVVYELPLAEIVLDYYDQLKSRTRGYASLDYDFTGFREGELVRGGHAARGRAGRCAVAHRAIATCALQSRQGTRRAVASGLIPRQMFDVPIQAAIGAQSDRAGDHQGEAQGRAREVLRRRYLAQAQAARAPEGGQEADEAGRRGPRCPRRRSSPFSTLHAKGRSTGPVTCMCTCRSAGTAAATATSSRSSGAPEQHGALRRRAPDRAGARARAARGRGRHRFPGRRHADVHARRSRSSGCSPRFQPAAEVSVEANPETVSAELARPRSSARVSPASHSACRAFSPHLLADARACPRPAGSRPGRRSTICVMPVLTTSHSISSTASPARAPPTSSAISRPRSTWGRSTSRATSWKRNRELASRTRTARSSTMPGRRARGAISSEWWTC